MPANLYLAVNSSMMVYLITYFQLQLQDFHLGYS